MNRRVAPLPFLNESLNAIMILIGGLAPAFVWRSAIASACRTYSLLKPLGILIFLHGILIRNLPKKLSY